MSEIGVAAHAIQGMLAAMDADLAARIDQFLASPFQAGSTSGTTWREWLTRVLIAFRENPDFSGKRPLGESSWELDLEIALVNVDPLIALKGPAYDGDGWIDGWEGDQERIEAAWRQVVEHMLRPS